MVNIGGSRLRPRSSVTADGSKQFLDWYDTKIHASCTFDRAADGSYHCLPSGIARVPIGGGPFFSDARCMTGVDLVTEWPFPLQTATTSNPCTWQV